MRWTGNHWVDGTDLSRNDGYYTWNKPYYAPATGYIASCWRSFPDDLAPGEDPPNNDDIFHGGNHVVIITGATPFVDRLGSPEPDRERSSGSRSASSALG
jgi:hypothetical protein